MARLSLVLFMYRSWTIGSHTKDNSNVKSCRVVVVNVQVDATPEFLEL